MNIRDIPEKTCPICNRHVPRRTRGFCPGCGARLVSYRVGRGKKKWTIYVLEDTSCVEIVKAVRDLIRIRDGLPKFDFLEYRAELGAAKLLLNYCDGSQSLALMVVGLFFDDRVMRRYRVRPMSVRGIIYRDGMLPGILALAKTVVKPPEVEYRIGHSSVDAPEVSQGTLLEDF